MRVLELRRYPVKSIGGEQLDEAEITPSGIRHDRGWGVVDPQTGNVLTGRREPKLLMATARMRGDRPEITTDRGQVIDGDEALSEWLDRPATLVAAAGREGGVYENPRDAENETDWTSWQGPPDAWHDSTQARVSIVGSTALRDWDPRRFRTNLMVDGDAEESLVGRTVKVGTCELEVRKRIERCVMVTRPQPGLDRDLDVLRMINSQRGGCLAVGATIASPGRLAVGDELTS